MVFRDELHIGVDSKLKLIHSLLTTAARRKPRTFTNRRYRYRGVVDEVERGKNRTKSSVRAKVEHPFHVIKRVFGGATVRYRGLAKNTERLWVTCGLTNLFMVRRRLLRA